MSDMILQIATWLVPLTIAIVFHEVAHGKVAHWFGDATAKSQGRLSLNPLKHVDPIGTVVLPLILALTHAPIFGWAKPVPVVPSQLRNPRWHMVLVAAAGPISNIILALIAALSIGVLTRIVPPGEAGAVSKFIAQNLINFAKINIFLALFNMIPIPPFDGSKVLAGFLPDGIRQRFQALDRYALLFMIGLLVVVPQLFPSAHLVDRIINPPAQHLFNLIRSVAAMVGGG